MRYCSAPLYRPHHWTNANCRTAFSIDPSVANPLLPGFPTIAKDKYSTYVLRSVPVVYVEDHPDALTVFLTDEQKTTIATVTRKTVEYLQLTALALDKIIDAVAHAHGMPHVPHA